MNKRIPDHLHHQVSQRAERTEAVDFFNILTGDELLDVTEAYMPAHRERLYPPTVTLSMFTKQVLSPDKSCQKAVNRWAAQRMAEGLQPKSVGTGGYCQARQRLPLKMIRALTRESAQQMSQRAQTGWRWLGRPVRLVDGTVISMTDTKANQQSYRQPSTQAIGVGFPSARVVGVICLSTGGVLDAAMGPFLGKGSGETDMMRQLLEVFRPGDVVLADALYCTYFLIAALQAKGVDVVMRQHGARRTDFRRGKRLGPRDHQVDWPRPQRCPAWMTRAQYHALPDHLSVREVRVAGQVLVTTLSDPRLVSKAELGDVYEQRWQVELDFRNIKATLGMAVLDCKTPTMIEKELWVHLLAYNLIRLLMAQAALIAHRHPRELSFKHTVQLWLSCSALVCHYDKDWLLALIAQRIVGNRPGRVEPRARKRRPRYYPRLTVPRQQARELIRKKKNALVLN